jgi:glucose dehydrogenase
MVWQHQLESTPHGTPMTCQAGGRQFVVVAVGGMGQKSELLAFALPSSQAGGE